MGNAALFLSPVIALVVSIKCCNLKKHVITKFVLMTDAGGCINGDHDQLVIGLLVSMAYLLLIIQTGMAVLSLNIVGKDRVSYLSIVIP